MKPTLPIVFLVGLSACGYWGGHKRHDVAPTSWGTDRRVSGSDVASDSVPAGSTTTSVEARLQNLEKLNRAGVISDAEHRERRRKVLADTFER